MYMDDLACECDTLKTLFNDYMSRPESAEDDDFRMAIELMAIDINRLLRNVPQGDPFRQSHLYKATKDRCDAILQTMAPQPNEEWQEPEVDKVPIPGADGWRAEVAGILTYETLPVSTRTRRPNEPIVLGHPRLN